ncbi:MAG TPA: serine/threonine-protein kinase, partial [Polyangiaceae bacterium LLY-WYZ-15_(1-7)]|nr:serine/threonine-protein kinase [Polyangiaceae bacterium LLY-WYZ-15_(1-7)]
MAGLRERASETFESWLQAVARVSDAPVAPALPPLVPGAQLAGGRFTVGRALGQGGMGAVYEAHDAQLDALVALKTLAAGNPELLLRLKGEFRSLQDLHHPNLVTLGELHEDRGRWFFTMERIHGVDFLAHLRGERPHEPPDLPRLRAAFLGLTRGLRALHRAGKVHRDVKPSNVLVGEDGRVVLLDFGLVTERRAAGEGGRGEIVGTVAYMAPEQAAGATPGPAADWYAAGVMLHEALTGRLPVSGSREEVLAAKGAPPPALPPDVPQELAELCRRLLAPDPKERATGSDVLRVVAPFRVEPGTTPARFDVGFVGRTNELRTLEELFLGARLGQPAVVHLVGEPGIGKSALLRQLAARLGMIRSTVVLEGRCRAREHVPFRGIDGVVDALAAALRRMDDAERCELVPPRLGVLRDTFPVLGAFGAAEAEPIPEPRERRREVFALLRELLARLAERRPVAVLIDDLHWADADSLAALEAMLRPPEAPPERAGAPLFPRARVLGLE